MVWHDNYEDARKDLDQRLAQQAHHEVSQAEADALRAFGEDGTRRLAALDYAMQLLRPFGAATAFDLLLLGQYILEGPQNGSGGLLGVPEQLTEAQLRELAPGSVILTFNENDEASDGKVLGKGAGGEDVWYTILLDDSGHEVIKTPWSVEELIDSKLFPGGWYWAGDYTDHDLKASDIGL